MSLPLEPAYKVISCFQAFAFKCNLCRYTSEDCAVKTVTDLWVYQARYRIPVEEAAAGNWVLIEVGLYKLLQFTHSLKGAWIQPWK